MTDAQTPSSQLAQPLQPFSLIIFGITGDLAKRKVLPALYHLFKDDLLPPSTAIIGTSRRELSNDDLLKEVELCVLEADNTCDPDVLQKFRSSLHMLQVDPVNGADYEKLRANLEQIEQTAGVAMNRLFYLSIPPQVYGPIIRQLGKHGLNQPTSPDAASRLLVEKPFGYDLISAEELIVNTQQHFSEAQIFRIDHYLAKETAQNILTFRQRNPLFRDVWNHEHIDRISITATEKIGIEGRADFYEQVGALRDLIQSHLMQLLTLTTMEIPADITDGTAVHNAKQALLVAVRPPAADQLGKHVTRGQYEGYRQEVSNDDSVTETFASIDLTIDTPRWQGVNCTLTTGKALNEKRTEITVCFKDDQAAAANQLTFRIQPNEGIDLQLCIKRPGFELETQSAHLELAYQTTFDEHDHPDAYERVLIDAARGDHMLFATSEEVLASWRVLQPIFDYWQHSSADLKVYAQGSTGPIGDADKKK